MTRNLKPEYINKIRAIEVPNGYKFDIANYLYNPDVTNDYPSFVKMIGETETTQTFRRIYYIKHWDGTGSYKAQTYTREKNGDAWQVVKNVVSEILESANRFNINKLLAFCK